MDGDFIFVGRLSTARAVYDHLKLEKVELGLCVPTEFSIRESPSLVSVDIESLARLGFPKGARYGDILDAIPKSGRRLCEAEDGPAARLYFNDQLQGWRHHLFVGMRPLPSPEQPLVPREDGTKRSVIFLLANGNLDAKTGRYDERLWLHGRHVSERTYFPPTARFLFRV